jgi:UDP-N-acetylmuramyl pentapeptide phosphotransferase/UDP-N-acetylglucosamine-1-phosphate transferase
VGSTAIGFFLACLPFASSGRPLPLLAVALAISLFFMDATTTLVRRVLQGERWFEAHRTHIYQRPLALGVPHARITYAGYVGMAIVAALAGYYPRAESFIQGLMHGGAVVLFAVAWWVVRRMEQGAARMETRADAQPSSRSA